MAPHPYLPDEYEVRHDADGGPIVIRPGELIIKDEGGGDINELVEHLNEQMRRTPRHDEAEELRLERISGLERGWELYAVHGSIDVLDAARELNRFNGVTAQPHYVYFAGNLGSEFAAKFDPNLFAPNLFAPNLFAPNLFAPNLFAPNLFAPNLFAGGGGGGDCCCPGGLDPRPKTPAPALSARPVPPPSACSPDKFKPCVVKPNVEIHVIDTATPGAQHRKEDRTLTGQFKPSDDPATVLPGDAIDENGDGQADPAMGHGDFVKSVIDEMVGFESKLWHSAGPTGDFSDKHLVEAMEKVKAASNSKAKGGAKYRILNLSLSGYPDNGLPDVYLEDTVKDMIKAGWLIVASAGNNASCRLAYPAAFDGVVAVGAYGDSGPAWFSNYGTWLDASAPGVNVIARYPNMTGVQPNSKVTSKLKVQGFHTGWARWSGTSFSAPFVVARLANQLRSQDGTKSAKAAYTAARKEVIGNAENHHPYYGAFVE